MTKFYEPIEFYIKELDELYGLLNEIDKRMEAVKGRPYYTKDLQSQIIEVRDGCLFRINLTEGWIKELKADMQSPQYKKEEK